MGNADVAAEQGIDPIHQFRVEPIIPIHIGGVDVSFTNSSLFMLIIVGLASLLMVFGTSRNALVPSRLQSAAEMGYEFVASTIKTAAGTEGMRFFPFVFSVFIFVLFSNLLGLVPYAFTVTSQIVVTFALAILVIGTVIGLVVGYGLSWAGGHYHLIALSAEVYSIDYVPFAPLALDGLLVALLALGISLIATIYPSYSASRILPAEALRYE